METRWRPSFSASCAHATAILLTGGNLVDEPLAAALVPFVGELGEAITAAGAPHAAFLQNYCALAADVDSNRQLAEAVLAKTVGPRRGEEHALAIARLISGIEAAISAARPKLAEELALRVPLLREQWEARGPGLLRIFASLTVAEMAPARGDVVLVEPFQGGGGAAHHGFGSIRFEAVLVNPLDELPEITRLAWLMAQLPMGLPRFQERLLPPTWRKTAALAVLPAVLAAAEEVELLRRLNETVISLAIAFWRIAPGRDPAAAGRIVSAWWQTYRDGGLPWPEAVVALDLMLAESGS